MAFVRPYADILRGRFHEPRRRVQVVIGPRQVGKTTLVRQLLEETSTVPWHYASADEPSLRPTEWIEQQWEVARIKLKGGTSSSVILVLDEVQKAGQWSEAVKRLWDQDTVEKKSVKVVLLGSSSLLLQKGLSESLAGRFEVLRLPHWSFTEMREAFHWSLEQYIFYGGYPGAADLIDDFTRWSAYIKDSLIETTIARDLLLLTRVDKPALLRRLFQLACLYSGQILSYQKMLGQLQDAGNTTTLAHYLDLLHGAGMVRGLQKFAGDTARSRGSSPKLLALNTALITAQAGVLYPEVRRDASLWGRLVESAVGAHLANGATVEGYSLYYWRERNQEVDFILKSGNDVTAIEVKTGSSREPLSGMHAFSEAFHPSRKLLVGNAGVDLETFLRTPVTEWA